MVMKLPVTNGVTHLPSPSGRYSVGYLDIFSKEKDDRLPLLFRLYYPSDSSAADSFSRWANWFPNHRYAEAYARYKVSSGLGSYLIPVLGRFFGWLTGYPKYPAIDGAKILNQRFPVVVFSHGLAACRTTYSLLCTDIASQGYYVAAVEHADGSACLRMNVDSVDGTPSWKWRELLPPGSKEYDVRNSQVKYRAREVSQCLDALESIDRGDTHLLFVRPDENLEPLEEDPVSLGSFLGMVGVENSVVAGHSFGGATTVLSLSADQRLKGGVALDTWMFPIKDEVLQPEPKNLIFINCEKFQGKVNLTTMKTYEKELNLGPEEKSLNVLTVKKAIHYAPTDIPLFLENSKIAQTVFGETEYAGDLDAYSSVMLNSELLTTWTASCLGQELAAFISTLSKYQPVLEQGIQLPQ